MKADGLASMQYRILHALLQIVASLWQCTSVCKKIINAHSDQSLSGSPSSLPHPKTAQLDELLGGNLLWEGTYFRRSGRRSALLAGQTMREKNCKCCWVCMGGHICSTIRERDGANVRWTCIAGVKYVEICVANSPWWESLRQSGSKILSSRKHQALAAAVSPN